MRAFHRTKGSLSSWLVAVYWPFHLIYTFQPNNQPFLLAILLFFCTKALSNRQWFTNILYWETQTSKLWNSFFHKLFKHSQIKPLWNHFLVCMCVCVRDTVFAQNFYFSFGSISCDFFFRRIEILWAWKKSKCRQFGEL